MREDGRAVIPKLLPNHYIGLYPIPYRDQKNEKPLTTGKRSEKRRLNFREAIFPILYNTSFFIINLNNNTL